MNRYKKYLKAKELEDIEIKRVIESEKVLKPFNALELLSDIAKEALSYFRSKGVDTMFFLFDKEDIQNVIIMDYEGSEGLMEFIGRDKDIDLDNTVHRRNNYVVYVEVIDSGTIGIRGDNWKCEMDMKGGMEIH